MDAEPDTPLLWVIREQIGLTGTKYGCGVAQCGACTVHIDGVATRSCVAPVSASTRGAEDRHDRGALAGRLAPRAEGLDRARRAAMRLLPGGMIMAAAALLQANPKPTEADIANEITNICRCGTYARVRAAIKLAANRGRTG